MTKTKTMMMQTFRLIRDADVRLTDTALEILADILIEQASEEAKEQPAATDL